MDPPRTQLELRRQQSAIETELTGLARRDAELRSALIDLEHDLRRCNDALERLGWSSRSDEARRDLLLESRAAISRDREKTADRFSELERRLARIRQRLVEDTRDD